jgi:hypothetical protein
MRAADRPLSYALAVRLSGNPHLRGEDEPLILYADADDDGIPARLASQLLTPAANASVSSWESALAFPRQPRCDQECVEPTNAAARKTLDQYVVQVTMLPEAAAGSTAWAAGFNDGVGCPRLRSTTVSMDGVLNSKFE